MKLDPPFEEDVQLGGSINQESTLDPETCLFHRPTPTPPMVSTTKVDTNATGDGVRRLTLLV